MRKIFIVIGLLIIIQSINAQVPVPPEGEGTSENPYQIATLSNLYWIGTATQNFSKHYIQTANINASETANWFYGYGWMPIGYPIGENTPDYFSGSYNGQHFTIQNLTITKPEEEYVGLFAKTYNGIVSNLNLSNVLITGGDYTGALAGRSSGGIFMNIKVTGIVNGQNYTGGIFGQITENCQVIKSCNYADVSGVVQVGGLIGTGNVKILECFNAGQINGSNHVGGLAGYGFGGPVRNSYNAGSVTGDYRVGGLFGYYGDYVANPTTCYNVGQVSGNDRVGGIFGYLRIYSNPQNCYWNAETAGQIVACGESVMSTDHFLQNNTVEMLMQSNFAGYNFDSIWQITESQTYPYLSWQEQPESFNYPPLNIPASNLTATNNSNSIILQWQAPSLGNPSGYNVYANDTLLAENIVDLSFTHTNGILNRRYIYHITTKYQNIEIPRSNKVNAFFFEGFTGGFGTEDHPYIVSNANQLNATRYFLTSHFMLTANIDLSQSEWNQGNGWEPIGNQLNPFRGSFNGGNFTISNLKINRTEENTQGLFGKIYWGRVENLYLESVDIKGKRFCGGIAGEASLTEFFNCHVQGIVSGHSNVGGIVGDAKIIQIFQCVNMADIEGFYIIGGIAGGNRTPPPGKMILDANLRLRDFYRIHECVNIGTISGYGQVGGIAGYNGDYVYIQKSTNLGSVTGNSEVGGIAGKNIYAEIENCFNRAPVTANNKGGGIVGYTDDLPYLNIGYLPNIKNTYNTGHISCENNGGGIVGYASTNEFVSNSYWDNETSGIDVSVGGEPRLSSEMKFPYAQNTYLGWDFASVWYQDVANINDGYPFLNANHVLGLIPNHLVKSTLYPNPTQTEFRIVGNSTIKRVTVFDMLGNIVFERNIFSIEEPVVSVRGWNSGLYLVRIETNRGLEAMKIVVQF
jgi:hypothetical protein